MLLSIAIVDVRGVQRLIAVWSILDNKIMSLKPSSDFITFQNISNFGANGMTVLTYSFVSWLSSFAADRPTLSICADVSIWILNLVDESNPKVAYIIVSTKVHAWMVQSVSKNVCACMKNWSVVHEKLTEVHSWSSTILRNNSEQTLLDTYRKMASSDVAMEDNPAHQSVEV